MLRVNTLKACLVSIGCVAAVFSALAQTNSQFPASTNAPEPTPTPQTSPLLTPQTVLPTPPPLPAFSPYPTPLPDGSMPLALPPMPTPALAPTPLPDGTMPLTPPPMPTPVLQDANTLSEQLNLPIPAPTQVPEPLKRTGETTGLQDSEALAMQQKMVMADFEKSLAILIAKQRNPKVPNMTLNDAVQIALKQNPDILNAIQQIRLTRGQLIQVAAQAIPQLQITSSYNQQQEDLVTNGSGRLSSELGNGITLTDGAGAASTLSKFQIQTAAGPPSFRLAAAAAARRPEPNVEHSISSDPAHFRRRCDHFRHQGGERGLRQRLFQPALDHRQHSLSSN